MESRADGGPPHEIRLPVMEQGWSDVTFAHWPYPAREVERLLPPGLDVETWDGSAWVGLVLLRMRVRLPWTPDSASFATFPETNVRTYVTGPDGRSGIYFFSLDAGHLGAVLAARAGWGLPYFWAGMRIDRSDDRIRYAARRRGVVAAAARHDVSARVGPAIPRAEVTRFDDYLTARFTLWHVVAGRLARTPAAHAPWSLHGAEITDCDQTLLTAAGLRPPATEPLAHYSPGVDVRIGGLRLAG